MPFLGVHYSHFSAKKRVARREMRMGPKREISRDARTRSEASPSPDMNPILEVGIGTIRELMIKINWDGTGRR